MEEGGEWGGFSFTPRLSRSKHRHQINRMTKASVLKMTKKRLDGRRFPYWLQHLHKLIQNKRLFIYNAKLRQVELKPFIYREVKNEIKIKVS